MIDLNVDSTHCLTVDLPRITILTRFCLRPYVLLLVTSLCLTLGARQPGDTDRQLVCLVTLGVFTKGLVKGTWRGHSYQVRCSKAARWQPCISCHMRDAALRLRQVKSTTEHDIRSDRVKMDAQMTAWDQYRISTYLYHLLISHSETWSLHGRSLNSHGPVSLSSSSGEVDGPLADIMLFSTI